MRNKKLNKLEIFLKNLRKEETPLNRNLRRTAVALAVSLGLIYLIDKSYSHTQTPDQPESRSTAKIYEGPANPINEFQGMENYVYSGLNYGLSGEYNSQPDSNSDLATH